MIVGIGKNGDILVKCEKCDYVGRVDWEDRGSVFWDVFVGQELLRGLRHEIVDHSKEALCVRLGCNTNRQWGRRHLKLRRPHCLAHLTQRNGRENGRRNGSQYGA